MKKLDWREIYAHKLISAEGAVSHIKSGDRIAFGCHLSEPPALVDALVKKASMLRDVEIIHPMSPGPGGYVQEGMEEHFHHSSLYLGNEPARRRAAGHPIDYISSYFQEWPDAVRRDLFGKFDVALVQLSEPNDDGYCSYALDCAHNPALIHCAKLVIIQINPNLPYTGGARVHLNEADFIVEEEAPLWPAPHPVPSKVEEAIGKFAASLVPDGATIQCGIGGIPNSALEALKNKNDLGIHSEMMTEKMKELVELGVITGQRKTMHVGKLTVTNVCRGSEEYYRWMNNNPLIELYPVNYINDPVIIGRQYRQVSINSAVEIDLLGQANSEMVRGQQYSGIGGQVDFFRGVRRSGGVSMLALPSMTKNGISRISAGFNPGTCVTTTRHDYDYVITEYGIAQMYAKSTSERAEQLIEIAHPEARDELRAAYKKMNL